MQLCESGHRGCAYVSYRCIYLTTCAHLHIKSVYAPIHVFILQYSIRSDAPAPFFFLRFFARPFILPSIAPSPGVALPLALEICAPPAAAVVAAAVLLSAAVLAPLVPPAAVPLCADTMCSVMIHGKDTCIGNCMVCCAQTAYMCV
jgi:hypothetical protein